MDGLTRSGQAPLGCQSIRLLSWILNCMGRGISTIRHCHAHHEVIRPHALSPSISNSKLWLPMVACLFPYNRLQHFLHLRFSLFLLARCCSMVCLSVFFPGQAYSFLDRNSTIPNSHCINRTGLYISYTVMNSISTWWILLMPMPIVWSLALKNDKKALLSALFALGCL